MKLFKIILSALSRAMTIFLSGDLLYLYYDGSWYDPNQFIEYTEVIMLWGFIIIFTIWTIFYITKEAKNI
jgi:hypothetical protein